MPAGAPTACKGCGQLILFERQPDGKWLVSEWDETTMRKGDRHNCPNYQPKQKQQPSSTLPAGKIWSGSDRQSGQFTQYKVNQGLEQATQQTQNALTQKLNELEAIKKLVHDQNILLHTMVEEIKVLNNNVIAALVQLGDKQKQDENKESFYDSHQQQAKKKSEQFGEKGENAMSDEAYDY